MTVDPSTMTTMTRGGGGQGSDNNATTNATSNIRRQRRQRQRIVLLPGPHKTGTTTIQSFLVSLQKKNLLYNWEWPASSSKAFAGIAHSILFDRDDTTTTNFFNKKKRTIEQAWNDRNHSIVLGAELFDHVAVNTSFQQVPTIFRRLESLLPMTATINDNDKDQDYEATSPIPLEVVVMYRTPRSSHLVSAWKQQIAMAKHNKRSRYGVWRHKLLSSSNENSNNTTVTTTRSAAASAGTAASNNNNNDNNVRKDNKNKQTSSSLPPSLAEFLCHGQWPNKSVQFDMYKIVAAQLNPMGVAHAFSTFGRRNSGGNNNQDDDDDNNRDNVRIMIGDMSNISDIATTVVCEVLADDIPCTADGKQVVGWNKTDKPRVMNQRDNPTDLNLSNSDLNEVEMVLRYMDCYHYCELLSLQQQDKDTSFLSILHAKDEMFTHPLGWKDCCATTDTHDTTTSKRLSPYQAYLKLQEIGCRASGLPLPTNQPTTAAVGTLSSRHNDYFDMKSTVIDIINKASDDDTLLNDDVLPILYVMFVVPILTMIKLFCFHNTRRRRKQGRRGAGRS